MIPILTLCIDLFLATRYLLFLSWLISYHTYWTYINVLTYTFSNYDHYLFIIYQYKKSLCNFCQIILKIWLVFASSISIWEDITSINSYMFKNSSFFIINSLCSYPYFFVTKIIILLWVFSFWCQHYSLLIKNKQ